MKPLWFLWGVVVNNDPPRMVCFLWGTQASAAARKGHGLAIPVPEV